MDVLSCAGWWSRCPGLPVVPGLGLDGAIAGGGGDRAQVAVNAGDPGRAGGGGGGDGAGGRVECGHWRDGAMVSGGGAVSAVVDWRCDSRGGGCRAAGVVVPAAV